MLFSTIAAAALMASAANAHMIMKTPTPFNNPNNSPLDASGSDYPCKGGPTTKTSNSMQAGQNQTLSFTGTAVHGGGSCQLSVTTDTSPTKDSKFKVIHSIEGGCPGTDGAGVDFSFEVPSSVPNGEATFAWTWFNKIGNREMYMNCASITVSGGASDTSEFDKLPDMAIANIPVGSGANCKTTESFDYTFSSPGDSVQVVGSGPFKELCGGAANVGGGSSAGSSAASGATSTAAANNGQYTPTQVATSAAATSAAATTQAPAATSSSNAGGVFAPGASSADPVTSTVSTLVTVTSASAAPTGASNTTAAAQPTSTSGAVSGATCSTDGAVVCNGESQFGLCDNGKVTWMAVAAGTKCTDGTISKREFVHRVRRSNY